MDQVPGWIQAATSIVLALVTGLLCWVTYKYMRLTRNLSETAERQLTLMSETELHHRRADLINLTSLARRILKSLEELPSTKADHDPGSRLLLAALWRPEEVGELRLLAAKAGPDFADKAEQPAVDLNWILERINPVRSEPRGRGFEMGSFPWDEYAIRMEHTRTTLGELADEAAATAKTLSSRPSR